MPDVFHLDIHITDDMSDTQCTEAIREVVKGLNRLAGVTLLRGKKTMLSPCIQSFFAGTANIENAANGWDGPSDITVPRLGMAPRPQ
jgi:hypothetical protein